jgi:hypothetical protein
MKILILSTCLISTARSAATSTFAVSIPTAKPTDAFIVPKDFVGFGIKSASLNNFANEFSENLVNALASRMSMPPFLRVGGTSGDLFTFDPNQQAAQVCLRPTAEGCNSGSAPYLLGPSFFDGYSHFQNATMIIQAPLDNPINTTNTVTFVWNAWNKLGGANRVASIALGNEVEFIYRDGPDLYTKAALSLQASIIQNLSLSGDEAKIFQAGNTASSSVSKDRLYSV